MHFSSLSSNLQGNICIRKKNHYIKAPVSCVSHLGCCRAPCELKCFVYEGDNDAIISLLSCLCSSSLLSYLWSSPLEIKMRCERKKVLMKIWESRCLSNKDAIQAESFTVCNEVRWGGWKPWPPAGHRTCSHPLLWEVKSGAAAPFHFKS